MKTSRVTKRFVSRFALTAALLVLLTASIGYAHFQVILPSVVMSNGEAIALQLIFTHPMNQQHTLEMGTPQEFGVLANGAKTDMLKTLKEAKVNGKTAYTTYYKPKAPGDYAFYIVPEPYFEEAEDIYIQHICKVVVNAFGESEGWDAEVGLPVEIDPLVRPYGLWTGMLFRGVVKHKGKPVPGVEIEVEYWNEGGATKAPSEIAEVQVIKANAQGEFSFALPRAGWWGFAALGAGGELTHKGKPLSQDAVIWVHCEDAK